MAPPFHRHSAGFTLFELMIVLIIITITTAAVIPRIGAGFKRMEDREFLQEFTQTLKRAHLRAIERGRDRRLSHQRGRTRHTTYRCRCGT